MTDWKAVQKALDDRNEAERVARNARTDAAVERATADLSKVPTVSLRRRPGEEPVCPRCGNYNAMLGRRWVEGGRELLVCRDCNHACFDAGARRR